MSLNEYENTNYTPKPRLENTNNNNNTSNIPSGDYRAFSISWTENSNAMGIRPPNPQFQASDSSKYVIPVTKLPGPGSESYPVGLIQSRREPYAVDFMYSPYGELETRFGTNLGRN